MIFIGLAYEEEQVLNAMTEPEWHALRDEPLSYVEALRASGHLNDARPLQRARKGATVRVRGGRSMITDGPFAETKEQLGGFFLFEAPSLAEAIDVMEGSELVAEALGAEFGL